MKMFNKTKVVTAFSAEIERKEGNWKQASGKFGWQERLLQKGLLWNDGGGIAGGSR